MGKRFFAILKSSITNEEHEELVPKDYTENNLIVDRKVKLDTKEKCLKYYQNQVEEFNMGSKNKYTVIDIISKEYVEPKESSNLGDYTDDYKIARSLEKYTRAYLSLKKELDKLSNILEKHDLELSQLTLLDKQDTDVTVLDLNDLEEIKNRQERLDYIIHSLRNVID